MAFQKGNVRKRKKVDPFAGDKINTIDYKDVALLKKYISDGTKAAGQTCPLCGQETLVYQEGCLICTNCGASRCG